jgi:NADH:ubiquinone oxidoreductase subunit C
MFKSLRSFINSRLGHQVVLDDLSNDYGYFIKIPYHQLHLVAFFLKNDPDTRLILLDQIIALPSQFFMWNDTPPSNNSWLQLLYQLKSLKLPYRVTLAIEIERDCPGISSIANLFAGAQWQEEEIRLQYGLNIAEGDYEYRP